MKRFKLIALSLSFLLCIELPMTTIASNNTIVATEREDEISENDSDIDSEQILQTEDYSTIVEDNISDNTSNPNQPSIIDTDKINSDSNITPDTNDPDSSLNQDSQPSKTLSIYYVKPNISTFAVKTDSIDVNSDLTRKVPSTLFTGQPFMVTAVFENENTILEPVQEDVEWSVDHGTVTSQNQTAIITPSQSGMITVTVSTKSQTASYQFDITASSLALNKNRSTLYEGENITLNATTVPTSNITWTSSDSNIASVSKSGKVIAKKKGTAVVTATANNLTATCTIQVNKPSLTLNKKALTIYLKNPVYLKATVKPANTITWSSSNTKIATISSKGKIKGKKPGTVTITARANGIKKSCKITIKKPKLTLDSSEINVIAGYSHQLNTKTRPSNKNISWSSANKKIATVSSDGTITGIKTGTTTISASFSGITRTCKVTVEPNNYTLNKKSKTLLVGDTVSLSMPKTALDVSYTITQTTSNDVVSASSNNQTCTITALKPGTAKITATVKPIQNGKEIICTSTSTIRVTNTGISPQQSSCSVGFTKQYTLHNADKPETTIQSISWTSSKPEVASINSSGLATGKKKGTTKLTATITYADHSTAQYTSTLKVSSPTFSSKATTLALGCSYYIGLKGTNSYSDIEWNTSNPNVATVAVDGTITTYKKGTTQISAIVDGKTLNFNLTVSNPYLKTTYKSITKGKTFPIKVYGKKSSSTVKFTSDNKSIATVSKDGVVTGRNYGNANITVTVDGKEFTYFISIATQTALNATKTARSIINTSTYSQAYRMNQGYYDCSSLVFRAYKKNTALLGGWPSWAPTAAAQANYLANRGKVVSYQWVDKSQLLPGDLIFYGNAPNGRYKGIFHVSMYYGEGLCIEKPFRDYTYNANNVVMIARPTM